MKGFIEVNADLQYDPRMIAVDLIESFCNHEVVTASMSYCVKETYEELKALIEEAQKESGVSIQYVPYVPPQEPQIVPLPYFAPYRPDVYRTVPTCDTVTHPVGDVSMVKFTTETMEDTK